MARRNSILVSRTLYQIGVMTLIASIIWTSIALLQAINKNPTKIDVDKKTLEPITIGIDKEVLEKMVSRKKVELRFEPIVAAPAEASGSATPSPSDTLEPGGQR